MPEIKLKPCPFCGSDDVHTLYPYSSVRCLKFGNIVTICKDNLTEEEIAKAWNTRAELSNQTVEKK